MQAVRACDILEYRSCQRAVRVLISQKRCQTRACRRYASSIPSIAIKADSTPSVKSDARPKEKDVPQARNTRSGRISGLNDGRFNLGSVASSMIDDEVIIPGSLSDTLEAHKAANAAAIASSPITTALQRRKRSPQEKGRQSYKSKRLELERSLEGKDLSPNHADYEGKISPRATTWEIIGDVSRSLRIPYIRSLDLAGDPQEAALDRLSAEIQAAATYLTPTAAESHVGFDAYKEIESYIGQLIPRASLELIGSRANGLAMPMSDIDMNLRLPPSYDLGNETELEARNRHSWLVKIWKGMRKEEENRVVEPGLGVFQARVPILLGTHVKSGLEVQIQHTDKYDAEIAVRGLLAEYPNLEPLFKVVKQMLTLRSFNLGHGRLTSYPLLNMIAVVLKFNPEQITTRHLGSNLIKFLEFWTDTMDFYNIGIAHLPSKYVSSKFGPYDSTEEYFANQEVALDTIDGVLSDPVGARPALFNCKRDLCEVHKGRSNHLMVLFDPANPFNDLGKAAYRIKDLQATLIDIKQEVKLAMSKWDQAIRADGRIKGIAPSLLSPLLEGDYTLYNIDRRRSADREFGNSSLW